MSVNTITNTKTNITITETKEIGEVVIIMIMEGFMTMIIIMIIHMKVMVHQIITIAKDIIEATILNEDKEAIKDMIPTLIARIIHTRIIMGLLVKLIR